MPDERDQQPDEQTEESQAEASDMDAQSRLEEQLPAEGAVAGVEIVEPEHPEPVEPELPSAEPVELELPPDEPVEPTEGLEPEAAPPDPQLPEDSRAPSPEPPESPDRARLVYLEYELRKLRRMVEDLSVQNDELPTMDDSPELDDAVAMRVLGGAGVNSMQVGNSVALTASGQSGSSGELIREGGGEDGLWAKILGNAEADDPAKNRWLYPWEEVEKTVVGYPATPGTVDNWTTVSGGRSGTAETDPAYNTIENMNSAANAHVEGNGVDPENVADIGTFAMMPCTTDNVVWMRQVAFVVGGTTYTEYWFSYENGVDGSC